MTGRDLDTLREDIARLLPLAMERAVASYRRFAMGELPEPGEAKDFAQHHAACRAALNHLEALVKLARWANAAPAEARAVPGDELKRLVKAAQEALADYPVHPEDEA